MKTTHLVLFIAALLFGAFENLVAQEKPPLVAGARVRIFGPAFVREGLIGIVAAKSADTLLLKIDNPDTAWAIPFSSITQLEKSLGQVPRSKNALKGAGIGLLVGGLGGYVIEATTEGDQAVAPLVGAIGGAFNGSLIGASGKYATIGFLTGAAVGAAFGLASDEDGDDASPELWALAGAAFGGEIGIVLGGLIGLSTDAERWEKVPPQQIRFGLAPQREGLMLSASLSF